MEKCTEDDKIIFICIVVLVTRCHAKIIIMADYYSYNLLIRQHQICCHLGLLTTFQPLSPSLQAVVDASYFCGCFDLIWLYVGCNSEPCKLSKLIEVLFGGTRKGSRNHVLHMGATQRIIVLEQSMLDGDVDSLPWTAAVCYFQSSLIVFID